MDKSQSCRTEHAGEAEATSEALDLIPPASAGGTLSKTKIAIGGVTIAILIALYWGLSEAGMLGVLANKQALRAWIGELGAWGPLAVIAMMVAAIVMSPIPSGPIAMVAGAVFGPIWGAVYVVIGAELGAVIAFWIARCVGYEAVCRWARMRPLLNRLSQRRSQTWLMGFVLVSRLVPFISFDAVSYAVGLTPLAFWRFAIATLVGVIPVAFLLTYFGEELISGDSKYLATFVVLVSAVTLVPVAIKVLWNRYRSG